MAVSRLSQTSLQNAFPKGNTVWDGTTNTSAFDSIGSVTLGTSATAITFANIPQTYTHLQIRGVTKCSGGASGGQSGVKIQVGNNSADTGFNYHYHWLSGNGTAISYYSVSPGQGNLYFESPWNGTGVFGPVVIDIFDYANTNKAKNATIFTGGDWNGASNNQNIRYISGLWTSTAAINTITFTQTSPYSDGDFGTGTTLALYGIK